ncbi:MAG: large conductance mechanosensitive channel protein MscL [Ruminococcaceae bacterium]|nr:large conductance mechanosensitive channel protein MscL [Oscillospiraceae bacterium]
MKKFFAEFKKFITRGNVLDMSVGVIVGGAFTAIVNGMSNFILKPIINWVLMLILGKDSLSEVFTFLDRVDMVDETGKIVPDLEKSIYIDWGAFINAIINFILIALVLFIIVRAINRMKDSGEESKKGKLTKEQKKELKAAGIKRRNKAAVKAYFDEKARLEAEAKAKADAEAAEADRLAREANPTAEDLLKKIVVLLENK